VEHSLREEKRQQGRRCTVTSGMATQAKEIEVVNTAEVRSEILEVNAKD
jgi:predicted transcriptional regulator